MRTRQEMANMTDTELQVAFDGCCRRIRNAWDRGEPGKVSDVFEIALMVQEGVLRDRRLAPPPPDGWMRLFELPAGEAA